MRDYFTRREITSPPTTVVRPRTLSAREHRDLTIGVWRGLAHACSTQNHVRHEPCLFIARCRVTPPGDAFFCGPLEIPMRTFRFLLLLATFLVLSLAACSSADPPMGVQSCSSTQTCTQLFGCLEGCAGPDAGGCAAGKACTATDACCEGTDCSAAVAYVCCPPSGC